MRWLSPLVLVTCVAGCSAPISGSGAEMRPEVHAESPKPQVLVSTAAPRTRPSDAIGEPVRAGPLAPAVHAPPPELDRAAVAGLFAADPGALGSMSWGRPNRGLLLNAVQMPEGPLWRIVEPARAWGTEETIGSIMKAIARVDEEFPLSPVLFVGNISARRGGYLRPHRSHQSGRDADLGFYYSDGPAWYVRGTAKNLDCARTWSLVKAFLQDPNVEAIFIDRSIQRLLRDYAERAGESFQWLEAVFGGGPHGTDKRIFHEWGHLTHLHVRFRSPVAQETAARAEGPIEAMRREERARTWASARSRRRFHSG